MDLDLAQRLAGLSRATYAADPVAALPVAGSCGRRAFSRLPSAGSRSRTTGQSASSSAAPDPDPTRAPT